MKPQGTLKTVLRTKLGLNNRQKLIIGVSALSLLAGLIIFIGINSNSYRSNAETTGIDYTFNGNTSTAWGTASNWDKNAVPSGTANVIIPAGKTCVCGTSNRTCTNLTVNGTLNIDNATKYLTASGPLTGTGTITLTGILNANGGGTFSGTINNNKTLSTTGTFTMNGILANTGTITTSGSLVFGSTGIYQHNKDGGSIPTATWNINSTCDINGVTATIPTGLGQTFGNFTWDCNQSGDLNLLGALTTVNGNLSVLQTGNTGVAGKTIRLNGNLTVGGNFTTSGNTSVNLNSTSTNYTYNFGGNFNPGGNFFFTNGSGNTTVYFTGSNDTINITTTNWLNFSIGPTASNIAFHIKNWQLGFAVGGS